MIDARSLFSIHGRMAMGRPPRCPRYSSSALLAILAVSSISLFECALFRSLTIKRSSIREGSLLVALKRAHPELVITALVRSADSFDAVRAAGAEPVQGSAHDFDLVASLAAKADIVINAALNDDVPVTDCILRGMRLRYDEGRGKGVLIHTSGIAVFLDKDQNAVGRHNPGAKHYCVSLVNSLRLSVADASSGYGRGGY